MPATFLSCNSLKSRNIGVIGIGGRVLAETGVCFKSINKMWMILSKIMRVRWLEN